MTQNHTEEVLIIPRLGTAQGGRHGVPGVEALSAAGKRGKRYERGAPGLHRQQERPPHPLLRTSRQLKRRSPGSLVVGLVAGSEGPLRVRSHRPVSRPGLTEHKQPVLEFKAREDGCAKRPPCQGCKQHNTTQHMSFLCVLLLGPNAGKCVTVGHSEPWPPTLATLAQATKCICQTYNFCVSITTLSNIS